MKKINANLLALLICFVPFFLGCVSCGDKEEVEPSNNEKPEEFFSIPYSKISERDPFVFVDTKTKSYYIHSNASNGTSVYKSKDLRMWRKIPERSFIPDNSFWGKTDFWAPDVYLFKDKYYMFITVSGTTEKRGTTILVSDNPEGPFKPLINKAITPSDWMCLDGSLYIDKANQPWLVFCREWLEVKDGEIYAQKLSADLTSTIDEPILLFKASSAPWIGSISAQNVTGYVTDAPFIYTMDNEALIMLWSSFDKTGKYVIAQATSLNGNIIGPWQQESLPLNSDDGGHAMLFKDLEGKLKISYHAPNSANWRVAIKDVSISENKVFLTR